MRKQKINTLFRKKTPAPAQRYGVRFVDDPETTIRLLPSDWHDPRDRTGGIHTPVDLAGRKIERFDGDFMDMLHDSPGDSALYAFTEVLSNVGLLPGIDGMTIYKVTA